jgi:hypothetical protein
MKPDDSGKPASRKEFRQALTKLSRDELIKLVSDLYSTTPDNRRFLEAKFALAAPLETYKEIIEDAVFPDVMKGTAPISFATARKAISDYKKATGDQKGVLELMVYAVERGNAFTVEYGDIDERFYNNLESLFRKTVLFLKTMDGPTTEAYLPRLTAVVEAADGIGWGYYDGIADALAEAFPEG